MKITGFAATADLVGRRIRVSWTVEPEGAESLADAPPVAIWRKTRDWEFPAPLPSTYVAYDEAGFPSSSALSAVELPEFEIPAGADRILCSTVTVSRTTSGTSAEVLRRTTHTTIGGDGLARSRTVEILDTGDGIGGLTPGCPYYYQLVASAAPTSAGPLRCSAVPGDTHGYGRTVYDMLPEIWRRHDVVTAPASIAATVIPEANPRTGQLRRLVDLFGLGVDSLRSSADGLRLLHDVDNVESRHLSPLAQWIGWTLAHDQEAHVQRNELKSAARLYRGVGTIPGIRAIATRYTGWHTQVAEFVQSIARANDPGCPGVHGIVETANGWTGIADVADLLGFGPTNANASGIGSAPAVLTASLVGPYNLRPGHELKMRIDGAPAVSVRFEAEDFVDLRQASAAEVAAAIDAADVGIDATVDSTGHVTLLTRSSGATASIEIIRSSASLVALETAPGGRLSALIDRSGHVRLFHDTARQPLASDAGVSQPMGGPTHRRIALLSANMKGWREPDVLEDPTEPWGSPSATELPDGRIWLSFVARPTTGIAELRHIIGTPGNEGPAQIAGDRRAPFRLVAGSRVTFVVDGASDVFNVVAADYADLNMATVTEVVSALNLQLGLCRAVALTDGSIVIETLAVGPDVSLTVDLQRSTSARTLGFARQIQAQGTWDEQITWAPQRSVLPAGRRWLAEPSSVAHPDGGVRVFWCEHRDERWRIASAFWEERLLFATSGGVARWAPGVGWSTWDVVSGLPSADVRGIAVDADGAIWFATAGGGARRGSDGTWVSFPATTPGIPVNDVRAVAVAPDESVWFGTPAGCAVRGPTGLWERFGLGTGLSSDDVRALAVGSDGTAWVATALGLSERRAGLWRTWRATDGLGSDDVRAVALAFDDKVWVATVSGLVRWDGAAWTPAPLPQALTGAAIRALATDESGDLWCATSAGVGLLNAAGGWSHWSTASGLPSNDVRAVALAEGRVWVGTSAGAAFMANGVWTVQSAAHGLAADDVRAAVGCWSATASRASGGGGCREVATLLDGANRTWLVWSQRQGVGTSEDQWLLRQRRYDAAGGGWLAESAITTAAPTAAIADREPGLLAEPSGALQVYFRSNRGGEGTLWRVELDATGSASPPEPVTSGPSRDYTPAPVRGAGGAHWVLFRSDRNVPLAQLAPAVRTHRVSDEGSLRRVAGTTTVVPGELTRNARRQLWGDLLAWTVQRPDVTDLADLGGGDLYTRGTLGLYVSRGRHGHPLTTEGARRLGQILSEFLPINLRTVLFLAPSPDIETVYSDDLDLADAYADVFPNVEVYAGLRDASAGRLPDWGVIVSNLDDHVSADPADLTTFRRRTWFPSPPSEEEP